MKRICPECNGRGTITVRVRQYSKPDKYRPMTCRDCKGTGFIK